MAIDAGRDELAGTGEELLHNSEVAEHYFGVGKGVSVADPARHAQLHGPTERDPRPSLENDRRRRLADTLVSVVRGQRLSPERRLSEIKAGAFCPPLG